MPFFFSVPYIYFLFLYNLLFNLFNYNLLFHNFIACSYCAVCYCWKSPCRFSCLIFQFLIYLNWLKLWCFLLDFIIIFSDIVQLIKALFLLFLKRIFFQYFLLLLNNLLFIFNLFIYYFDCIFSHYMLFIINCQSRGWLAWSLFILSKTSKSIFRYLNTFSMWYYFCFNV